MRDDDGGAGGCVALKVLGLVGVVCSGVDFYHAVLIGAHSMN